MWFFGLTHYAPRCRTRCGLRVHFLNLQHTKQLLIHNALSPSFIHIRSLYAHFSGSNHAEMGVWYLSSVAQRLKMSHHHMSSPGSPWTTHSHIRKKHAVMRPGKQTCSRLAQTIGSQNSMSEPLPQQQQMEICQSAQDPETFVQTASPGQVVPDIYILTQPPWKSSGKCLDSSARLKAAGDSQEKNLRDLVRNVEEEHLGLGTIVKSISRSTFKKDCNDRWNKSTDCHYSVQIK
ncbi:hypothetical protein F2P81_015663 [Scophthalmus maximus]|uniref:Uncharacterized protein n=1 Tax=Scophthalmus maximus TaxID=52904 RepID=A0A6A4SFU9_SCOMX|nr:hypothetical protein F2P81_015663 [Scophthalmus maximus]